MNNAIFKSLFLGLTVCLSQTGTDGKPVVLRGEPTVKHYIVHILGDAVGGITAGAVAGTSAVVGSLVASGSPEVAVPAIAMSAVGCMAAVYIYYKTPEWTDTYLLERGQGRTVGQNMATMLTRLLPLWPLGVVAGEYLVYEDDVNGKN